MGDQQEDEAHYHARIQTHVRYEREWVVEVLPLVAGQRSVREKEWLEAMKTFGISAEDEKRIIYRLGHIVVYCCQSMRNCSEIIGGK